MPSSQDQSCSLLAISKQHTEEEILPPRDIINERRFCWCKDKFFFWQLLVTNGALNLLEGVGGGVGEAHKTFPHGVSVTRESLSGLKVKTKCVLGGTQHNTMCLPAWHGDSTLRPLWEVSCCTSGQSILYFCYPYYPYTTINIYLVTYLLHGAESFLSS